MRFPTVEYMEWAKTIPDDALQMGASGVPLATLGDIGHVRDVEHGVRVGLHAAVDEVDDHASRRCRSAVAFAQHGGGVDDHRGQARRTLRSTAISAITLEHL